MGAALLCAVRSAAAKKNKSRVNSPGLAKGSFAAGYAATAAAPAAGARR